MVTREELERRQAELEGQLAVAQANVNAVAGALQLVNILLSPEAAAERAAATAPKE